MTWRDDVPTEDGWYYVKHPCGVVYTSELTDGYWDGGFRTPERGFGFGPRIPYPDELETMRTKIAELTQQRDAAEAELEACREKLAEIDTGGINLEH